VRSSSEIKGFGSVSEMKSTKKEQKNEMERKGRRERQGIKLQNSKSIQRVD